MKPSKGHQWREQRFPLQSGLPGNARDVFVGVSNRNRIQSVPQVPQTWCPTWEIGANSVHNTKHYGSNYAKVWTLYSGDRESLYSECRKLSGQIAGYPCTSPPPPLLFPPTPFTNPLQSQVCKWCAGKCSFCFTTQVHMYYYCKTVPKLCPCTYVILLQHFVPKLCPCTYVLLLQNFVPKYIRTIRTTFVYIRTSVYQSLVWKAHPPNRPRIK